MGRLRDFVLRRTFFRATGREQLDAVLLGEDACERPARQVAAADENLAEQPTASLLLVERVLELGFGQEAPLGQQGAERTPGELRLIH